MEHIRHFIHQFDMFAAAPTLRARGQPQIANSCGGIFSILLLGFFFYVLVDMNINIVNYQDIKATERIQSGVTQYRNETIEGFAILFEDYNIQDITPMFRFNIKKVTMNRTKPIDQEVYETEICTDSKWDVFGNDLYYGPLSLLCIKNGTQIQLTSNTTSGIYDTLTLQLQPCSYYMSNYYNDTDGNYTDDECYSEEEVQLFQEFQKFFAPFFTVRLYMVDTAFNPTAKDPISSRFTEIRSTFTTARGSEKNVFIDHYLVKTDTSLLPFEQEETVEGWMLGKEQDASFEVVPDFYYMKIVFMLSTQTKIIERLIGKLDEALSYVGGLFGIIIGFFAFFVMSFNEYRYELMVGEHAFNYSSDGKKIREEDFHFLYYLKYSLYDWLDLLCCCQLGEWGKCKQIHETRQQANQQLNVTYLFKRLHYYERIFEYLLSNQQRMALHLTEPPSLQTVAKNRKYSEYYSKITKGKSAMTLEDIEVLEDVLTYGVNLALGKNQQKRLKVREESSNRIGFPSQVDKSRSHILDLAIENFSDEVKMTQEVPKMSDDSEQAQIEREMAEAMFKMPKKIRAKIQEKIPLKIMNRLKIIYNQLHEDEAMSIHIDIQ